MKPETRLAEMAAAEEMHMNEEEWLICSKPDLMLVHLQKQLDFRALKRKLRLFICACRRVGWDLTATPDERVAVEVAERFADGQVTHVERDAARWKLMPDYLRYRLTQRGLMPASLQIRSPNVPQMVAAFACEASNRLGDAAQQAAAHLVRAWTEAALEPNANQRPGSEWKQYQAKHRAMVCYLLRDLFGTLPFRFHAINPLVLAWSDNTVPQLALGIYDEYAFDRLPILADALEEAGCDNTDILNHCREPGEHVRGCWVIDLLLGKS